MNTVRFATFSGLALLLFGAGPGSQGQTTSQSPEQDSQPIDLSNFYGKVAGTEGDSWFSHPDWKIVPKGLQTFDGILFDVSGTLLLKSQNMPQLKEAVRSIPVKRKCSYIHLLHGIGYSDEDGTVVANMEVHYGNGEKRQMPIILGAHVRNWWKEKEEKVSMVSDPGSGVAWSGQGEYPPPDRASVRLFRSTFANPMPDQAIDHIDFVSQNSKAILCVVSLSVGDKKPAVKSESSRPAPSTR
ncbi:MAG TPA: hypothetical protein VJW76_09350 [Verrucomicrobiae bacterium]|nr:hypothetical protein [Verrucomicrobiae bacterium]